MMGRKRKRYKRRYKRWFVIVILGVFIWWITGQPLALQAIATVLSLALRLAFGLFYMVIQFWGLMYFLSGTKTEKIMPGDAKTVTLDDYKGQPVVLDYAKYLVSVLEGHADVKEMGGEPPRGVLFIGVPGGGKTYLAKCMAGEAKIPFFLMDASSLSSMWMGMGGIKVRRFFATLKKHAQQYGAAVAVLDELDAIGAGRGGVEGAGMFRGGFFGGGMGVLNTLLSCLDGLEGPTGLGGWVKKKVYGWLGKRLPNPDFAVLVIGSTNRPGVLDAALTRAGRFDQQIRVKVQNVAGLDETVQYYLGQVAHDSDIDTRRVAQTLHGVTPADIKSAIKRGAVQRAVTAGRTSISERDIYDAAWEAVLGVEMPEPEPYEPDQYAVAAHEAGHAIACVALFPELKPLLATVIPHAGTGRMGASLGVVIPRLTRERQSLPLDFLARKLMMSMAGREATHLLTGRLGTGFGGDRFNMQAVLVAMIQEGAFGYAESILLTMPGADGQLIPSLPKPLRERIEKYLAERARETRQILCQNRQALEALTELLVEEGTLTAERLEVFFDENAIEKWENYDVEE